MCRHENTIEYWAHCFCAGLRLTPIQCMGVHGLQKIQVKVKVHTFTYTGMLQWRSEGWQTWWSHKNDILLVAICTSNSAQRLLLTLTNGSIWCGLGANHHLLSCQTGFSMRAWLELPWACFFRITWAFVPWKAKALTPHVVFVRPIHCLGIMKAPTSNLHHQKRISMGKPKTENAILIHLYPALTQDLGPLWWQNAWS